MSDIDYSQFHYNRKHEQTSLPAPALAKPKHRKSGKAPLVVLIVVLCFALTFFSVDFFTNGYLIDKVSTSLKGNSYNYYLVVMDSPGRELSYAQSLLVKQGGGSGYIINDEGFKVVYSVFVDKSQANTVSSKNTGTYVYNINIVNKDTTLFNTLDNIIRDLIAYGLSLEKGDINESDILAVINANKFKLINMKEKYIKDNDTKVINLIDFVLETFNSFNLTTDSKIMLLSDIRYATANIIIAMSSVAT